MIYCYSMDEIEKDLQVLPALIVKRGIKAFLVPRYQGPLNVFLQYGRDRKGPSGTSGLGDQPRGLEGGDEPTLTAGDGPRKSETPFYR